MVVCFLCCVVVLLFVCFAALCLFPVCTLEGASMYLFVYLCCFVACFFVGVLSVIFVCVVVVRFLNV